MIPEAAVEAAAAVLCGVTPEAWASQATHTKDTYRWEAIAALEAAAPHMLAGAKAEALGEAAELIEPFSGIGMANGATRGEISRWLRERADMLRPTT